jgi:hypothetical protein
MMARAGAVRGEWCTDGPHGCLLGGIHGSVRGDGEGYNSHIQGEAHNIPEHGSHPPGVHSSSLPYIHTMVSKGSVLINEMRPILESDSGHWDCPDDGPTSFVVSTQPFDVVIEGKSVGVQNTSEMISSLHGGQGTIVTGGSNNVMIGLQRLKEV